MIYPDTDDMLASIIDTFDRYIAPEVHDEYAASLCLTVSQLLRAVRARVANEHTALTEDNAELRSLLVDLRGNVAGGLVARIADVTENRRRDGDHSIRGLQSEALDLRDVLVAVIAALPDVNSPARAMVRAYLEHHLRRQQPWLVDAYTGPRR